ncbi:MAG TPA: G1 family glutamic endopeptidase [Solirubrobacteraceae bacterium]
MGRSDRVSRRCAALFGALALVAAITAPALAVAASDPSAPSDAMTQPVVSASWAGYDAIAASTPAAAARSYFTGVTGSWTAPALRCGALASARASVWVGLGGVLDTRAVYGPLQVGIDADCRTGRATYSAWYEAYPEPLQRLRLTVASGDALTANVSIDGAGRPHVSLRDLTSTHSAAATLGGVRVRPLATDSAEWIVEGPVSREALADFGSVTFTNATATESSSTGTHSGGVDDPAWGYSEPDVIGPQAAGAHLSDVAELAAPGPLAAAGEGFTVNYDSGALVAG